MCRTIQEIVRVRERGRDGGAKTVYACVCVREREEDYRQGGYVYVLPACYRIGKKKVNVG